MIARSSGERRSVRVLAALLVLGVACLIALSALLARALLGDGGSAGSSPVAVASPTAAPTPTAVREQEMLRRVVPSLARVESDTMLGSAFLFRESGDEFFYATNAHVVGEDTSPAVITSDGVSHPARLVGTDAEADIAVLAISGLSGVTPLPFAGAADLETADTVYVVGYVLGFDLLGDPTVSRGIVSGRRLFEGIDYIQTDASMNPGNSGGPMLDATGAVVGMSSWGIRGTGDLQIIGINFAIPSETLIEVTDRLIGGPASAVPAGIAGRPHSAPVSDEWRPEIGPSANVYLHPLGADLMPQTE